MRAFVDASHQAEGSPKCSKYSCDLYREVTSRMSYNNEVNPSANEAIPDSEKM